MVSGKFKSGRFRKVFRRTPGAKTIISYRKRNPSKARCGNCGSELKGVPRLINSKARNIPKTKKRPERPYGGVLCSKCSREVIKKAARTAKK